MEHIIVGLAIVQALNLVLNGKVVPAAIGIHRQGTVFAGDGLLPLKPLGSGIEGYASQPDDVRSGGRAPYRMHIIGIVTVGHAPGTIGLQIVPLGCILMDHAIKVVNGQFRGLVHTAEDHRDHRVGGGYPFMDGATVLGDRDRQGELKPVGFALIQPDQIGLVRFRREVDGKDIPRTALPYFDGSEFGILHLADRELPAVICRHIVIQGWEDGEGADLLRGNIIHHIAELSLQGRIAANSLRIGEIFPKQCRDRRRVIGRGAAIRHRIIRRRHGA